jgi:hypothetical protein
VKTIEEYAIDLVANGAESTIEDDLNEDGEVSDEDHEKARDLAMAIVRAIRTTPGPVLALTRLITEAGKSAAELLPHLGSEPVAEPAKVD